MQGYRIAVIYPISFIKKNKMREKEIDLFVFSGCPKILVAEISNRCANIEKMRADGAQLFRYSVLKKLHSEVHFDQNTGNGISI